MVFCTHRNIPGQGAARAHRKYRCPLLLQPFSVEFRVGRLQSLHPASSGGYEMQALKYDFEIWLQESKRAAVLPYVLQYPNHPAQLPACPALLDSAEMATHPNPLETSLFHNCFDHSRDDFEECSVKGTNLQGRAAPTLLSWQVFIKNYICMETGCVLGSEAPCVYYPQIKP